MSKTYTVTEVLGKDLKEGDEFWNSVYGRYLPVTKAMLYDHDPDLGFETSTFLVRTSTPVAEGYTKEQMEEYGKQCADAEMNGTPQYPPLPEPTPIAAVECYVPVSVKDRLPEKDGVYYLHDPNCFGSTQNGDSILVGVYSTYAKKFMSGEDIIHPDLWLDKRSTPTPSMSDEDI